MYDYECGANRGRHTTCCAERAPRGRVCMTMSVELTEEDIPRAALKEPLEVECV